MITVYVEDGSQIEHTQAIAGHESRGAPSSATGAVKS